MIAKGKLSNREAQYLIIAALNEEKNMLRSFKDSQDDKFKVVCDNQDKIQQNINATLTEIKNLKSDLYRKGAL